MLSHLCFLRGWVSSKDLKHVAYLMEKNIHSGIKPTSLCYSNCHTSYTRVQNYSTESHDVKKKDITVSETKSEVSTLDTIKENTKTVWYGSIAIIGVGVTGILLYTILSELFSSESPNNIYAKAFDRCITNEKVIFSLGEPIKGHGEETRRRRRRHVSHLVYEKDGINYMRMKFYLKGSRKSGTVHLEMKENEKKKYDYRYLFVQMDEYPYTTIVLEDNRSKTSLTPLEPLNSLTVPL